MSLFVPKEVGEFFARATRSLDGVDALIRNANAELTEWRKLRECLTERVSAAFSSKQGGPQSEG